MARGDPLLPIGVVLAGGESRRMGRDKALLRPGGHETLLERALTALGAVGLPERAVSVSSPERAAALREAIPALAAIPFVVDATPGCGPLAGLHAALTRFPGRSIVVVACDMPGLDPVALRLLLDYPDADVVVPCPGGRAQPLHARYGPACRPVAKRLLAEGRLAMRDLLAMSELRVRTLDGALLARHHVSVTAFDNVNTAADLAALANGEGVAVNREDIPAGARVADEGDLCRLWAARTLPADGLATTAGERLHVIYPGRRTGTGGPDFQGAIVADAAGRVRCGDVELHLRSRDWIAHGHRADLAYNGVILHVVLEDDGLPCLRADGTPIPVVALGRFLTASVTTTASASNEAEPCRVSPALTTVAVREIVRAAGRTRLRAKASALEGQIEVLGAEQALFTALLDAAGYSRNRAPCAALAERIPVERLYDLLAGKAPARAVEIATAILLGLAGLLPVDDLTLRETWERCASLWPLPPLAADDWVRASVRPANRPELRLRGVAALVARHARLGLAAGLLAPLDTPDGDIAKRLVAGLAVPAAPGGKLAPIGTGRAVEMAVNVLVPFGLALAQWGRRRDAAPGFEDRAWLAAAELAPGEDSEPLRQMQTLLLGAGHRLRGLSALETQGLLHLHRTTCGVRACWECPLSDMPTMQL